MHRLLKLCLLWLLAAVIPLQGLAASVVLPCTSDSQAAHAGMHDMTVGHVPAMHDHGAGASEHAAHMHASGHDIADSSDGSSSSAAPDTCASCAACCVGASLPAASFDWSPAVHDGEQRRRITLSSFTGYIPGGLERPPRAFLV